MVVNVKSSFVPRRSVIFVFSRNRHIDALAYWHCLGSSHRFHCLFYLDGLGT